LTTRAFIEDLVRKHQPQLVGAKNELGLGRSHRSDSEERSKAEEGVVELLRRKVAVEMVKTYGVETFLKFSVT
jgi:hypothetical protein